MIEKSQSFIVGEKKDKKTMEVMAVPNPRAYVLKGKQEKEAEIKTIKLEAYKEFAEKMYENIEKNEGLYPGQEMPKMWASFAVQETLDELEGKL